MNAINLLDLINNYWGNLHTFLNKYLTGVSLYIPCVYTDCSVTSSKAILIVLMERAIKDLVLLKHYWKHIEL